MPRVDPLVSSAWLASHRDGSTMRLIDLRIPPDGGRDAYRAGHVPGAVYSDYATDGWRKRLGDVPGLLPEPESLSVLLGSLGISPEMHVVLVPVGSSANDLAASARAFWTLKMVGHEDVSILDGGTRGWLDAGLPLESGDVTPTPAGPYPVMLQAGLRQTAQSVEDARASGVSLIDARSVNYFKGLEKAQESKRAGHIPGALSLDYVRAFEKDSGKLAARPALEALFSTIPGGPVINYCNTGHTAALNWFILSELLGRADVSLYDGSMTDWTQDPARAVETG